MSKAFGEADASFQAAGGEAGLRTLVDAFYDEMAANPAYQRILHMHPEDLEESRDKLARFLCGWLGGPRRYSEKYGSLNIPTAHAHLAVDAEARDGWLACMAHAVEQQPWSREFKDYLLQALHVPAEAIRLRVEKSNG